MKISVVIPMYNASSTIVRALDSIKNQTYKCNYQILVVNDGSKDDSKNIVEGYIANNPEMDITLINQENGGVSKARNMGLKNATGDYIALLDSDDCWLPTKIERQISIFNENQCVDFLGTTRNGEKIDSILWKRMGDLTKITAKNLLIRFVFVTPTILFKRDVLKTVGYFNEQQKYAEEGNYFIRVAQEFNCYLLNESLVITGGGKAHFGESGLSGDIWNMEKGELKNIKFAYQSQIISLFEYVFVTVFSLLKYFRRWIIVKIR